VLASGPKLEDIASARDQAESLRQAYELAKKGPLPEEISAAQSQADSLHFAYLNAQDSADRARRLYDEGAVSEREYIASKQVAETAYNQWQASVNQLDALKRRPRPEEVAFAKARYEAALDTVESLKAGATPEQLKASQTKIDTAGKALERVNIDLSEATVIAPSAGLLNTFSIKPGDFVAPGQPVAEIVDLTDLKVKVYVPENRLGLIHEGMEVPVRVDSYPGENFKGVIESISAQAEFTPRNVQTVEERVTQVFAVTIRVPNPENRLRPGMSADMTIDLKK
jgi:HlyD family secretion protein